MNSFVLISEKKCVFTPCVRGKTWLSAEDSCNRSEEGDLFNK